MLLRLAVLSLLLLAVAPRGAFAVPENNYGIVGQLMDNRDGFFTPATFPGLANAPVAYTKFGSAPGAKGCLVISAGLGEPSLKYLEVAYDLSQQGFSPIYAIDHRGQGASGRLLPDPQKISVQHFDDFVQDFTTFVDTIVRKDPACQGHPTSLLAHSLGGAITAAYLEKEGANSPFRKVVLTSPMLKIAYPSGHTEDGVILEGWFACTFNVIKGLHCDDFAPGYGPYNPNAPFAGNPYTHSLTRFEYKKEIYSKWPALQTGGPTVGWVRQAALADHGMREACSVKHVAPAILLLQAAGDTVVDNAGENEFCGKAQDCRLERIEGANHELLMETDAIRDHALTEIVNFLGNQ